MYLASVKGASSTKMYGGLGKPISVAIAKFWKRLDVFFLIGPKWSFSSRNDTSTLRKPKHIFFPQNDTEIFLFRLLSNLALVICLQRPHWLRSQFNKKCKKKKSAVSLSKDV